MWGKDKNRKVDFDRHAGKTTMIAKGTVVNGDVVFEGGLLVEGTIKGNVRAEPGSESLLRLSEAGVIEGEIHVPHVVINGKVSGDVHSSVHVELAAKAVVNGNVHYQLIEMVMGAEVNGALVHIQPTKALPNPATAALDLGRQPRKDDKVPPLETKQSPA